MSATTIDIDDSQLQEAKALLGTTTTEATVHEALRELVAQRCQTTALALLTSIDLDPHAERFEPTASGTA